EGAHFIASSFPYSCRPTGSREGSSLLLRADIKYCTAPEVPTIFVPGYGTSINLSQLVKAPTAEASREGWRFIDLINPEYGDFLETLKASSVPHEIAYYDWRLPAELASQLYLEPFIEKVKAKYGSQTVNLVTHSFGGIVGRSYISSDRYKGDVAKIIQVAPPNQGAAKAYSAWQGGILPPDWQPLMHLVRFYSYWFKRPHDPDYQIIRTFFPSAKDLLPIYPSLLHSGQVLDPSLLTERNQTLLDLSERTFLFKRRVSPIVFAGNSIQTLTGLHLSPGSGKELWPDGQPLQEVFDNGDATVPVLSSVLPEEETFFWPAGHSEIIKVVAEETVETLYPGKKAVTAPEKPRPSPLSFLFDCPISVSITFPNGIMRSSEEPDGNPEKGEVFSSPELLWMVVPKMLGEYTIQIKARETTEVRWWVENGDIHTFHMEEGEEATLFYRHEETAKPTPFLGLQEASPAPQLSLHSATPTPSPPKKYVPYKIALDSKPTNPSEPVSSPVPEEKPHEESTNNLHFLLVAWATGGTLLILASLFALKKKRHKL
ncbi:MAG: lecithin:cholesterol acyltransferase, partial [Patescibacteria group bacterium]|nr:lecithin:cholesterol acyltransferase [Patescibacteria group bacterium]